MRLGNAFSFAALPQLPVQPAEQLDPDGDRHGAAVLQHPRDLHGQPRVLAREPQRDGEGCARDRTAARSQHHTAGICQGESSPVQHKPMRKSFTRCMCMTKILIAAGIHAQVRSIRVAQSSDIDLPTASFSCAYLATLQPAISVAQLLSAH
jgi:hypothetical protein